MSLRPSKAPYAERCPIRDVLDRLGDRWSLLVMGELKGGKRRFSELRRGIDDISQRMLALTLRHLEEDGLISRTVYPTVPPSVEYALTDLGQSLQEPVDALVDWAGRNHEHIRRARSAFREPAPPVGLPEA